MQATIGLILHHIMVLLMMAALVWTINQIWNYTGTLSLGCQTMSHSRWVLQKEALKLKISGIFFMLKIIIIINFYMFGGSLILQLQSRHIIAYT